MNKHTRRLCLVALGCAVMGFVLSRARLAPAADPPERWAFLPWDQAVGRIIGHESDSEGPKSFAVKADGGVLLLDQVNARVLSLDAQGRVAATISLPATTFDDVEQVDGQAVLALDRLVSKVLLVMDPKGTILAEVPLEGRGIERSGLITAILPRPDGVWLEVEHRYSVKVVDRLLKPCERQMVLGRPIANGRSLHGELDGHGGVSLSTSLRNDRKPDATVTFKGHAPISRIVWLDADAEGRVHAVLHEIERAAKSPFQVLSERYWLVVFDDRLHELGRIESPWVLTQYDQRVEFRLGPDGRLWQMAFTPEGVHVLNWGRRVQ